MKWKCVQRFQVLYQGHQRMQQCGLVLIPHLSPGGSVPAQAGLQVTGQEALRPGGHSSAVKRSQGPLVPHVHTRHLPRLRASLAVPGALRRRRGAAVSDAARHVTTAQVWSLPGNKFGFLVF